MTDRRYNGPGGYQPYHTGVTEVANPEAYMGASAIGAMRPELIEDMRASDKPISPLAQDMQSLHKELAMLNESIKVLRSALSPVMSPVEKEDAPKNTLGKPCASYCEVGSGINEARGAVVCAQEVINNIFQQLQV